MQIEKNTSRKLVLERERKETEAADLEEWIHSFSYSKGKKKLVKMLIKAGSDSSELQMLLWSESPHFSVENVLDDDDISVHRKSLQAT